MVIMSLKMILLFIAVISIITQGVEGRRKKSNSLGNKPAKTKDSSATTVGSSALKKKSQSGEVIQTGLNVEDDSKCCIKNVILRFPINESTMFLSTIANFYTVDLSVKDYGCGYRNLQTILSALNWNKMYKEKLIALWKIGNWESPPKASGGSMPVPSLFHLQKAIEWSWEQGFDEVSRFYHHGRLSYQKTRIGASEIDSLLSALEIKTNFSDFSHMEEGDMHLNLLKWVENYFTSSEKKFPVFMQDEVHSRVIIGYEKKSTENGQSENKLLVLDPDLTISGIRTMSKIDFLNHLRLPFEKLREHNFYQLVSIIGIMTPTEYEERKKLNSTKFA